MDVGKKYLVFRDGHSFVDDRGNLVSFDPECKRLLILPKPATVIMDDGETESLEQKARAIPFLQRRVKRDVTLFFYSICKHS